MPREKSAGVYDISVFLRNFRSVFSSSGAVVTTPPSVQRDSWLSMSSPTLVISCFIPPVGLNVYLFLCECVCACTHVCVCSWRSEVNLVVSEDTVHIVT